ncbi:ATP synthase subunit delta, mitochondrial-like [Mytilus edulis]|uniref:F-ATPase delta subunit n=1 Tax=Mytilus edulis TaxID=6550 RepID=A0A8S3Q2E4_MYTED|nr:ATP16 [Mytilus edulis]
MALFRQVFRSTNLLRQCSRVAAVPQQHRGYAEMAFTFACPSDVFYANATIQQVDVPATNQSFGILANHVPTIAVLQPGVVIVTEENGEKKKFFVSSGSVTVNKDSSVQVLAEEAHPIDRFDRDAVRDGLNKAQADLAAASTEMGKAEAQVAIDCYAAVQKAME